MIHTGNNTQVIGREEVEDTLIRKNGRFLFWKTEWWERISTEHIGHDIFIKTERPIGKIYLNNVVIFDSEIINKQTKE